MIIRVNTVPGEDFVISGSRETNQFSSHKEGIAIAHLLFNRLPGDTTTSLIKTLNELNKLVEAGKWKHFEEKKEQYKAITEEYKR